MGARCFCEKQKQIEGPQGDHDAMVLCVHRCVVNLCVLCFNPKAHALVHTSGQKPAIRTGRFVGRNHPRVTAPPRSHQLPALQPTVQQRM